MGSGLEVTPWDAPEIIAQPDANKYIIRAEHTKDCASDTPLQLGYSDPRIRDWRKWFFLLALFAVLTLAVAVGVGLGVGLAAQHKSTPSRSASRS